MEPEHHSRPVHDHTTNNEPAAKTREEQKRIVLLFTSVPLDELPPALSITGSALLIGGAIGFLTGIRGPHWPIYALIFTGLAVLLLLPHPWQGLTFVPIPTSAAGYAMGKEVAFLRPNLRKPVSPVRQLEEP